jgi:hypothetical protein
MAMMGKAAGSSPSLWVVVMPINQELQGHVFNPDEVAIIIAAFEDTLRELNVNRADPMAALVAKKMIDIAKGGERDPARLREQTLRALRP